MRLALIQPQFAPNLYDLSAMLKADEVYLLDNDTWSRKGRSHRAKIRTEDGTSWINVPVVTEDRNLPISQVRIDHSENWFEAFWNDILHNYSTATYFDYYKDELYAEFKKASRLEKLVDFDLYMLENLFTYLQVSIDYQFYSQSKYQSSDSDIIYQEYGSKNYIRQLEKNNAALKDHPEYQQCWPDFEPECSCLDLLLNHGIESFRVLELLN